ncbi:MAG: hypothetical protein QOH47_2045 [Sphingomonadales bacterium]|jgi:hypothetical protein|nr:hypothetical protein [Sphingomonadales bacterium]
MAAEKDREESDRRAPRPRHDSFCEERKQLFLVGLRRGDSVLAAAAAIGVSSRTAYRHRERDPDFARAWDLACRMAKVPLELAAFARGVDGIEEPVYRYGKLSHTRRRLSDATLIKLLAADQPEKYGRAAGLAPLIERLERKIKRQVAAEVAEFGNGLRSEIADFMTQVFDRILPLIARSLEGREGKAGAESGPDGPEISPNPV